jgi:hypothetical protein
VRRSVARLLAGAALAGAALAIAPVDAAAQEPGASLEVTVLTFGQGDYVWERFGHNAIQVEDRATGASTMWHWGLFDFDQPNFVGRFLTGDTRYWMEGFDPSSMLAAYESYDRTIVAQRLRMTPAQKLALLEFLRHNEQEEHKYYRYDYFRDNCSTRLRDALDRALGGTLRRAMTPLVTDRSYRSESLRLVDAMPLTQAGMHVALGHPADRPITAWEEAFVPMRLRDQLRAIRVPDGAGAGAALVADERVLYASRRPPEATSARALLPGFLVVGLVVAGALVLAAVAAARGRVVARGAFGVMGALWGLVPGLMGLVLLLAWTATRHDFWDRNENLFQLGPQSLPLAVLVPLAIARPRHAGRALGWALVVVAISATGLALKLLPWFRQPNLAVVALALPAHAALAWGLVRYGRPQGAER